MSAGPDVARPDGVRTARRDGVRVGARLDAVRAGARIGAAEFAAVTPLRLLVATALPRAILQTFFLTLLAAPIGTGDDTYAALGAVTLAMTTFTLIEICDLPIADKYAGTGARLRNGTTGRFPVLLARAWPYPAAGFVLCLVVLLVCTGSLLPVHTAGRVLLAAPVLAVIAASTACLGLVGGLVAIRGDNDVLVGNLLAYLTLVAVGALFPAASIPVLGQLGAVLPLGHGLRAVRGIVAGTGWAAQLGLEVLVGAGWLLVAYLVVRVQEWRAVRDRDVLL